MWLNLCNAVGLVPGLDEDRAALLTGLSRDADDDELPIGERSVREGEYAHRACFLHFSSVGDRKGDGRSGHCACSSLNFVEFAFSGTVFQKSLGFGEFLNLFCVFSLLSVCVRIRPDEFGRVSVGL